MSETLGRIRERAENAGKGYGSAGTATWAPQTLTGARTCANMRSLRRSLVEVRHSFRHTKPCRLMQQGLWREWFYQAALGPQLAPHEPRKADQPRTQ